MLPSGSWTVISLLVLVEGMERARRRAAVWFRLATAENMRKAESEPWGMKAMDWAEDPGI